PLDLHPSLLGPSPRFVQEESGPIDPCHDEPLGGQGDGKSAWPTAKIEHLLSLRVRQPYELVRLESRLRKPALGKHERVERYPERVVFEPFSLLAHFHVSDTELQIFSDTELGTYGVDRLVRRGAAGHYRRDVVRRETSGPGRRPGLATRAIRWVGQAPQSS